MVRNIRWFTYGISISIIVIGFIKLLLNHDYSFRYVLSKSVLESRIIEDDVLFASKYSSQQEGSNINERNRLINLRRLVADSTRNTLDEIPTVPCLSADKHLLVLSASASQVRYGVTVTFMVVFPTDVRKVLQNTVTVDPKSPNLLNLCCIFTDGSASPAYSYDLNYGNDRVSLIDCPLPQYAVDQLWKRNQTLLVYVGSLSEPTMDKPIFKAFVSVPKRHHISFNDYQYQITLCTSPLHNKNAFLPQWIEFHRLVGFQKFVIYNTTDDTGGLTNIIDHYFHKYPNLIDVVQWNFSSLHLKDVMNTRYFQLEALHDCLIRYGDQSEWLGAIDLDEYIVPLRPYETIVDYLTKHFRHKILGSINLWSLFYCTERTGSYSPDEKNTSALVIERFVHRAKRRHKGGREKYLYRPRFVQYLSIHHQVIGLRKQEPNEKDIVLAHFSSIERLRVMPGCDTGKTVVDTSIRDRFARKMYGVLQT